MHIALSTSNLLLKIGKNALTCIVKNIDTRAVHLPSLVLNLGQPLLDFAVLFFLTIFLGYLTQYN